MKPFARVLLRLQADLRQLDTRFALVGGWAVSVRANPRTTQDIDVVVAVDTDREAENLVRGLRSLDYEDTNHLEHERAGRLSTVRFLTQERGLGNLVVDVLFASSGIEPEIVESAEPLRVLPGVIIPVARVPHLLALKVLAGRPIDLADAEALLAEASTPEIAETRHLLDLISRRGFDRGKDLQSALEAILASASGGEV